MDNLRDYVVGEWIEEYEEGRISRRELLRRVTLVTGSLASAAALLTLMGCGEASAPAPSSATSSSSASTSSAASSASASATSLTSSASGAATTASSAATGSASGSATGSASPSTSGSAAPAATTYGITVPPTDPAIEAGDFTFDGLGGAKILAYRARPKSAAKAPGVLVNHENQGMLEHFKDVCRRWAKEGYAAMVVDLMSREGGTARFSSDLAQVSAYLAKAPADQLVGDLLAGLKQLAAFDFVDPNRLGAMGFCFGGGMTWRMATKAPNVKAAVPWYGPNPPLEDVPNIKAAMLVILASQDQRITGQMWPELEPALKKAGVTYDVKILPGPHGFYNDTRSSTYTPDSAREGWKLNSDWFAKYLK